MGVSVGVQLCGSLAGAALAANFDFTAAARPLWLVCAGFGVIVAILAVVSTSPRAIRSEKRLAPLIAEPGLQEPAYAG